MCSQSFRMSYDLVREQAQEDRVREEGFSFSFDSTACVSCGGKCCNGESGDIFVDDEDISRISDHLGVSEEEFVRESLRPESGRLSVKELKEEENYACLFYDPSVPGCGIYPVRPQQCRTFPFWGVFRARPDLLKRECPGVTFDQPGEGDAPGKR